MFGRLVGGVLRAALLVFVIGAPAFLLPDATVSSQEITLIVAGLAAAFTVFEYASTHPGLIDFRFAPPYNRVRYISFAVQVLTLTFLARAMAGHDSFGPQIIYLADRFLAFGSFPLSPLGMVRGAIPADAAPEVVLLMMRSAATSFWLSFMALLLFGLILLVIRWPVARRDFNLWLNLPTFAPGYASDVERRLRRDGLANLIAGFVFLYLAPPLALRLSALSQVTTSPDYQVILWSSVFWATISGSLVIRGIAVLKVCRLVKSSR